MPQSVLLPMHFIKEQSKSRPVFPRAVFWWVDTSFNLPMSKLVLFWNHKWIFCHTIGEDILSESFCEFLCHYLHLPKYAQINTRCFQTFSLKSKKIFSRMRFHSEIWLSNTNSLFLDRNRSPRWVLYLFGHSLDTLGPVIMGFGRSKLSQFFP